MITFSPNAFLRLAALERPTAMMAIGIAAAVIERDVKGDEHKDLIDSFIENMGDGND